MTLPYTKNLSFFEKIKKLWIWKIKRTSWFSLEFPPIRSASSRMLEWNRVAFIEGVLISCFKISQIWQFFGQKNTLFRKLNQMSPIYGLKFELLVQNYSVIPLLWSLTNRLVVDSNPNISYVFLRFIPTTIPECIFSNIKINSVLWVFCVIGAAPTSDNSCFLLPVNTGTCG